jgi:DNA-binding HxlR family transcriptional regulator
MANFFRSNCPVTSAVDLLGDRWILVIVKQMLLEQKSSFKDFTDCDEAIASNILTSKLNQLIAWGLVSKSMLVSNKRSVYYHLTDQGLSLAPIIIELALWGDANLRTDNPAMRKSKELKAMKANKEKFVAGLIGAYKKQLLAFDKKSIKI